MAAYLTALQGNDDSGISGLVGDFMLAPLVRGA